MAQALVILVVTLAGVAITTYLMARVCTDVPLTAVNVRKPGTIQSGSSSRGMLPFLAMPVLLFFGVGALGVLVDVQRHDSLWGIAVRVFATIFLWSATLSVAAFVGNRRGAASDSCILSKIANAIWVTSVLGVILVLLYLFVIR